MINAFTESQEALLPCKHNRVVVTFDNNATSAQHVSLRVQFENDDFEVHAARLSVQAICH